MNPQANPIAGEADGCDFTRPTRFDRLFTGIAVERPKGADLVTGAEGITAADTFDADYERLLERAFENRVEVLASPTGFGTETHGAAVRRLQEYVGDVTTELKCEGDTSPTRR